MKKTIFIAVAAAVLLSSPAIAADIPVKGPVYKAAAGYNWTGWYGGVNAGYGWDPTYWFEIPPGTPTDILHLDPHGPFGGFQLGFNRQLSRNWLIGIEADFQFADITDTYNFDPGNGPSFAKLSIRHFATLRGRIGHVMDRNLFYFTAGGAIANFDANVLYQFDTGQGIINDNQWLGGYVVGVGYERAFTNSWSFKVEYLYIDFSHLDIRGIRTNTGGPVAITGDPYLHIVRLGLNMRFSSGG